MDAQGRAGIAALRRELRELEWRRTDLRVEASYEKLYRGIRAAILTWLAINVATETAGFFAFAKLLGH